LDVLRVINELNQRTVAAEDGQLPATRPEGANFFDVDGNGFITPLDALGVINFLNSSDEPEGESELDEWTIGWEVALSQIAFDIARTSLTGKLLATGRRAIAK
jgi:hypothetical protein